MSKSTSFNIFLETCQWLGRQHRACTAYKEERTWKKEYQDVCRQHSLTLGANLWPLWKNWFKTRQTLFHDGDIDFTELSAAWDALESQIPESQKEQAQPVMLDLVEPVFARCVHPTLQAGHFMEVHAPEVVLSYLDRRFAQSEWSVYDVSQWLDLFLSEGRQPGQPDENPFIKLWQKCKEVYKQTPQRFPHLPSSFEAWPEQILAKLHLNPQPNQTPFAIQPWGKWADQYEALTRQWVESLKTIAQSLGDPKNERTFATRATMLREDSREQHLAILKTHRYGLTPSMWLLRFQKTASKACSGLWEYWPESFGVKVPIWKIGGASNPGDLYKMMGNSQISLTLQNYTTPAHLLTMTTCSIEHLSAWVDLLAQVGVCGTVKDGFGELPQDPEGLFAKKAWAKAQEGRWGVMNPLNLSGETSTPVNKKRL